MKERGSKSRLRLHVDRLSLYNTMKRKTRGPNTNLVEDVEILLTVIFVEFRSAVPVKFR